MNKNLQEVTVTVDGGYKPNVITLKQGQPAKINFIRKSDRGCLGAVQSKDLNFAKDLPLNQIVTVEVPTDQAGIYDFSCGMQMVHGKVEVK